MFFFYSTLNPLANAPAFNSNILRDRTFVDDEQFTFRRNPERATACLSHEVGLFDGEHHPRTQAAAH
jgi:hypothetical protein